MSDVVTQRTKSTELAELREKLARSEGKRYWKSLDELAENEEFMGYLHREFPEQASELVDPVSRRRFLHLMGASIALAGATACSNRTAERIVPYVRQPENLIPGVAQYYASTGTRGGYGVGVLVESHMGRPTKVEGNPDHPASLGSSDPFLQAETLVLYDPDRSETVVRNGRISTWESFLATASTSLAAMEGDGGAGLRLLTGTLTSPTLIDQIERLLERFPQARWHRYEPAGRTAAHRAAIQTWGEPLDVHYDLSEVDVVLTLDADLFAEGPASLRNSRDFADRRRVRADDTEMVRLYAVESAPGLSGAMADHRWRLKASEVEHFARAVAAELGVAGLQDADSAIGDFLALGTGIEREWISALAEDLRAGAAVVVPGEQQSTAVHALANAINDTIAAIGNGVRLTEAVAPPVDQLDSIAQLTEEMRGGDVDMLLILEGNPVFDAPADLRFVEALEQVPFRAHLGLYEDETSEYCHWHVPAAHWLESWGDARAYDGTLSVVQPLIEPINNGRSAIELLGALLGEAAEGLDLVRGYWQRRYEEGDLPAAEGGFERFWRRALHDGLVAGSALTPVERSVRANWDSGASDLTSGLEVVFRTDPTILDGRYANNGWLQEAPKPITKLTWDNAVQLSPATAEEIGVANGQHLSVSVGDRSVEGPTWIVPGQADGTVVLHMGYGRRRVGRVGSGTGFDVFPLRTGDAPWFVGGATVEAASGTTSLASTQHHHSMEGRDLARVGGIAEFRETGEIHHPHTHTPTDEESLYEEWEYTGHSWAMTIDLNVCTGCNGCLTACQAENNVPVVGKEEVLNGREMHWIRVDRYWGGGIDDPETVFQPLTCMHCENAPCEVVCPVAATVHGSEGLNEMVYNRCVGTRYCANNCPYKVRRFNFLDYTDYEETPVMKMLQNPDVTVRSRGVMEKCTYCVQRINVARQNAKTDGRDMQDGDVVPACAQACPTQAIVFGDMNDPDSEISRVQAEPLHYGVLTELGTRPRTNYLPKLRNRNPAIDDVSEVADVH